jgi:GNAT superfamily N-acetyltransferase
MRIIRWDPADEDGLRACYAAYLPARHLDDPGGPPMSLARFAGWLRAGWWGNPREVWFIAPEPCEPSPGWYLLQLPDLDNRTRSQAELVVYPPARRRGLGSALLEHAIGRASASARSCIIGTSWAGTAGERFARAKGARPGLTGIRRMLELAGRPRPERPAPAGYSLLSWTGPVPEERLEQTAALFNALEDAPRWRGVERRVWDTDRLRSRVNTVQANFVARDYAMAVVHDATGALAGLTMVTVDPAHPDWAHQGMTAVARDHRGHRLGLLLKIAMLDLLTEREPVLERIVTSTAESNRYMIAVNEALGFRVLGAPQRWWELDAR